MPVPFDAVNLIRVYWNYIYWALFIITCLVAFLISWRQRSKTKQIQVFKRIQVTWPHEQAPQQDLEALLTKLGAFRVSRIRRDEPVNALFPNAWRFEQKDKVESAVNDAVGEGGEEWQKDVVRQVFKAWDEDSSNLTSWQMNGGLWMVVPCCGPKDILVQVSGVFGMGDHPSTQMCAQWLDNVLPSLKPSSVLDYGSGNGILSFVAALHGVPKVVGVDLDPVAVEASEANRVMNDLADEACEFYESKDEPQEQYDLVVANILPEPLVQLVRTIAARSKPGALLGLSGIRHDQAQMVLDAYSEFFDIKQTNSSKDVESGHFVFLSGKRKANAVE